MKRVIVYILSMGLIVSIFLVLKDNGLIQEDSFIFESFSSRGDLVSDKDLDTLEDSGIRGEDLEFDTNYYPYYGLLSSNEKELYKQVYANVVGLGVKFVPSVSINIDSVAKVIEAVYNDHAELFWLDTTYSYKYTKNEKCVQIILSYNEAINDLAKAKSLFEGSANNIIREASKLSSDYEKEKYVHDVLIKMVEYNTSASMNQSAYSALVNHSSVCAGYARAFQYIMIELGIPTYYVVGEASEEHAWNIIKLSDGYYNVDVTWDDTNGGGYNYFNLTDLELFETHSRSGMSIYLPACNSASYSGLEGIYKEEVEEQEEENVIINKKLIYLRVKRKNGFGKRS